MAFFSMIKLLLLCTTSLSFLLSTPASGKGSNFLLSGEHLNNDESLVEGNNKLTMQKNCNLVLKSSTKEIWTSNTQFKAAGCILTLERNGILNITAQNGKVIWTKGPRGQNGNYILIVRTTPDFFIYGSSTWSPITKADGSDNIVIATTPNEITEVSGEEQNNVRETGKIMEVI